MPTEPGIMPPNLFEKEVEAMANKKVIEKIAGQFMVQCQKGEPFECPCLINCPHEDKDICQWQLDQAEEMIILFESLGYVRRVEDQRLPETLIDELEYGDAVCHDFRWGVHCAQQDILRANFVKVEKEFKI